MSRPGAGSVALGKAKPDRGSGAPGRGGKITEDLLYLGFQARFLEAGVRRLGRTGLLRPGFAEFSVDVRTAVIARAMRSARDGGGDLCHSGLLSPGPTLAFGATPLEFLRHVTKKGTTPASARAGGLAWTDLQRGMIGWGGPRGGMMTQVLAGAALAFKQRGEGRAALVFEERAAVHTGGWHEGMNLAGAVGAPLIVVVEESFPRSPRDSGGIEAVAASYGVGFARVAADPIDHVFRTAAAARSRAVNGEGPTLVELVPLSDRERWARHDDFAARVVAGEHVAESALDAIERAAAAGVDHAVRRLEREPAPASRDALAPVCTGAVPRVPWTRRDPPTPEPPPPGETPGAVDAG